jgi:hypothetical protein
MSKSAFHHILFSSLKFAKPFVTNNYFNNNEFLYLSLRFLKVDYLLYLEMWFGGNSKALERKEVYSKMCYRIGHLQRRLLDPGKFLRSLLLCLRATHHRNKTGSHLSVGFVVTKSFTRHTHSVETGQKIRGPTVHCQSNIWLHQCHDIHRVTHKSSD